MDKDNYQVIVNGYGTKIRIPYGNGTYLALEIVNGKLQMHGARIDLDQAEQLAKGILMAVEYIRSEKGAPQ